MKNQKYDLIITFVSYFATGILLRYFFGFEICVVWFLSTIIAIGFRINSKIK